MSNSFHSQNRLAVVDDVAGVNAVGAACDLTILGNGFFVVRDPVSNTNYVTQAGHFSLDATGCLVTDTGARVQGRINGALSALGDIQINAADLSPASNSGPTLLCYSIDEEGKITVHLSDGTSFLRGQIMLQNFQDPQALVCEGHQLYSNISVAGPLPAMAAPGSNGLGVIQTGALELSHAEPVDYWPEN
jgi:flagellar hook protein FlgE